MTAIGVANRTERRRWFLLTSAHRPSGEFWLNAVFLVSRRVVLRAGMALVAAPLVGAYSEEGDEVEIKRVGSQPSGKGSADWFTGTVRIDPLFDRPNPARVAGARHRAMNEREAIKVMIEF